jgi:hypothetical protein
VRHSACLPRIFGHFCIRLQNHVCLGNEFFNRIGQELSVNPVAHFFPKADGDAAAPARWLLELNAIDGEQRTTIHPPRQSLIESKPESYDAYHLLVLRA